MQRKLRCTIAAVVVASLVAVGCSGAAEQAGDPQSPGGDESIVEGPAADEGSAEDEGDAGMHASQPPTTLPGTASVGSLPRAVIRRVVDERMGEITGCYQRLGLDENPDLKGEVEVKLVIGISGEVTMAAIASTTLNHDATERCIVDVIRETKFPPPDGAGIVVVTYPFELTYE
jgi:hypothetical protein